jgi:glycosyltransferase involved in cell wall biosynthesis
MKIAHLIAQFYPHIGGAEICVHNVCRSLKESGNGAVVITTTLPADPKPDLPYEIIHLWYRTCGLLRKFPFIGKIFLHRQLAKLQKEHNFDLWQVTMGYPLGVYAVDFFKKQNIPCILRCCGEDIQKFPQIGYGYRLDEKIDRLTVDAYPKFDGLIALTETVREDYDLMGIEDNKIRIIPNGADFAKFAKIRSDKKRICEIRNKYGAENKKLILTTGRYHPKKGFDQIPEIARKLKEKGIDFKWIVAGPKISELRNKFPECDELGVICSEDFTRSETEDAFSLPPESLVELYCAADIFVLPTLIETFGMVLVEAMAGGLPIVTTDAPGVKNVIDEGVNGLKAETGNIDNIAEIVEKVLTDKELAEKLSTTALEMAENIYDWKTVTGRYLDFYKEMKDCN